MQGKIAVEEHFRIAETTGSESRYPGAYWAWLSAKLLDIHDARLAEMDKAGIEIEVISLNSNAVQGIPDLTKAIEVARKANDALADAVAKRPDRFAGLGALPMQDPQAAAENADAIYTDVCVSMGFEHESTKRAPIFRPFQVNDALMQKAASHAVFMHCLPARRNDEVTDAVIDGPQSIVFDQAENRLHVQKALLLLLLGGLANVPAFSEQ